jgi:hypothetical protein
MFALLGIVLLIFAGLTLWMGTETLPPLDAPMSELSAYIKSSYELGLGCFVQRAGMNDGQLEFSGGEKISSLGDSYLLKTGNVLPKNFSVFLGREIVNTNNDVRIEVGDSVEAIIDHDFTVQIGEKVISMQKFLVEVPVSLGPILQLKSKIQDESLGLDVDALAQSNYLASAYQKDDKSVILLKDKDNMLFNQPFHYAFLI